MIYLLLIIAGIAATVIGISQIASGLKRAKPRPIDAFELRHHL